MSTPILQQLLNDAIRQREEREVTAWYASRLGSCLTGLYLERKGFPPETEFDDRTLRVFAAGKLFEEFIINLLKKSGTAHETQTPISWPEYDLRGRADLVLDGVVYEIKTMHSHGFHYMRKNGERGKLHHRMQLWTYLKCLNLTRGELVYISKDDLTILQYPVLLEDKALEAEVLKELTILKRAWEQSLPPVPVPDTDWRAKYCRWHRQCISFSTYLTYT